MFKNVSCHLKINEIHEKYLSNIVECIDDKMEILYNCNGECRQYWVIVYYFQEELL